MPRTRASGLRETQPQHSPKGVLMEMGTGSTQPLQNNESESLWTLYGLTAQQWDSIQTALSRLALIYNHALTPAALAGMMAELCHLPAQHILTAINDWAAGRWVAGIQEFKDLDFFPRVRQLRVAASLLATGSTSEDAWEFVLLYIRHHGVEGKPRGGKPIYHATKKDFILAREDDIPAPQIPSTIAYTVERMGGGDLRKGLSYIQQHPYFHGWNGEDWGRESPHRVAEVIERRFRLEYEKAAVLGK